MNFRRIVNSRQNRQILPSNYQDQLITQAGSVHQVMRDPNKRYLPYDSSQYYPILGPRTQMYKLFNNILQISLQMSDNILHIQKSEERKQFHIQDLLKKQQKQLNSTLAPLFSKTKYQFLRTNYILFSQYLRYSKKINKCSSEAYQRLKMLEGLFNYKLPQQNKLKSKIFLDLANTKQWLQYINEFENTIKKNMNIQNQIHKLKENIIKNQIQYYFNFTQNQKEIFKHKYGAIGQKEIHMKQYSSKIYNQQYQIQLLTQINRLDELLSQIPKNSQKIIKLKQLKAKVVTFLKQFNDKSAKFEKDYQSRKKLIIQRVFLRINNINQQSITLKKYKKQQQSQVNEKIIKSCKTIIPYIQQHLQIYYNDIDQYLQDFYINTNNYLFSSNHLNLLINKLINNLQQKQYTIPIYRHLYEQQKANSHDGFHNLYEKLIQMITKSHNHPTSLKNSAKKSSEIFPVDKYDKSEVQLKLMNFTENLESENYISDSDQEYDFLSLKQMVGVYTLEFHSNKSEGQLLGCHHQISNSSSESHAQVEIGVQVGRRRRRNN